MSRKKKIIIVGGGISGLAAGISAIQQGFEPLILEKNPVLGGLCMG
ncbi:MAG: FAD-dependent oxidoreductase, partial [Bacilli bacterium]|nr:FAD-dependent oxidoreductase [Bacilli bacterium]